MNGTTAGMAERNASDDVDKVAPPNRVHFLIGGLPLPREDPQVEGLRPHLAERVDRTSLVIGADRTNGYRPPIPEVFRVSVIYNVIPFHSQLRQAGGQTLMEVSARAALKNLTTGVAEHAERAKYSKNSNSLAF
jgi:hypothetical protein